MTENETNNSPVVTQSSAPEIGMPEVAGLADNAEKSPGSSPGDIASATVLKRRGRHPNSCECDRCKARKLNPQSSKPGTATSKPAAVVDPILTAKVGKAAISSLCHGIDTVTILVLSRKARKANAPDSIMKELRESVRMTDEVREGVKESGYAVAEKYGANVWLPEISLLTFVGAHIGNMMILADRIDALARAEKDKKDETKNPVQSRT